MLAGGLESELQWVYAALKPRWAATSATLLARTKPDSAVANHRNGKGAKTGNVVCAHPQQMPNSMGVVGGKPSICRPDA